MRAYVLSQSDLDLALSRRLPPILRDDEGREKLASLLSSIADTKFARDGLDRLLSREPAHPSWRIGEALAEALLTDHRGCEFPWPGGRDLKNPNASAAGTDLVGFISMSDGQCRFAFGEVKTSSQAKWPPNVVNGRHGMRKQLEDLCSSTNFKDCLVRYLGHHAIRSDWQARFMAAAKRYFADDTDVSLFGVLVRDVDVDSRDLTTRATTVGATCPPLTSIELFAIYLPKASIDALPTMAAAGGGAQ